MTGISNVVIRYHNVKIDDVMVCKLVITGTTATPSIGHYTIVRRVVGSNNVYPMYAFTSTSTAEEFFSMDSIMNAEGVYSEHLPTTGEVTDIFIEQDGVQQGDAYRFTVEKCREPLEDLLAIGAIVFTGYVLYKLTMWGSDTKKYSYE